MREGQKDLGEEIDRSIKWVKGGVENGEEDGVRCSGAHRPFRVRDGGDGILSSHDRV